MRFHPLSGQHWRAGESACLALVASVCLLPGVTVAQQNYNLASFTAGTYQWNTTSTWNPTGTPGAADSLAISGEWAGAININYASGSAGTVSIQDISVTDTTSPFNQNIILQPGVAGSQLQFSDTTPTVTSNLTNNGVRVSVANPLFQSGSAFTKAGNGNVELSFVTTTSGSSLGTNVTSLEGSSTGGQLRLSNGTGANIALPTVNFNTPTNTGLFVTGGTFTATGKTVTVGTNTTSGNLAVGGGGTLVLQNSSAATAGNVVMSSGNSLYYFANGNSTLTVDNSTLTTVNLNLGDQMGANGTATFNQQAGATTTISNLAYLGFQSNGISGAVTQNLAINIAGGTMSFTRNVDSNFEIGRNSRAQYGTTYGVVTTNGTVTISGGTLDLGTNMRAVLGGVASATLTNGTLVVNSTDNTSATLNLNGGVIKTRREIARGTVANASTGTNSARVFLNGGTLETTGAITNLFTGFATVANDGVFVSAGGFVINTGGFNSGIAAVLQQNTSSTGGGLTKNGTGALTLSAANTFTGPTVVNDGTLALTSNLALQSSPLDTTGSGVVTLGTGITTPTFGGLSGAVNLATKITTGYSSATLLTLDVASGTLTYSGIIANGAAGMGVTKAGAGTQVLSGANTFTGVATVNAGTLRLGTNFGLGNATASGTQKVAMGGGTLDLAGFSPTVFGVGGSTGTITDSVGGGTLTISVNDGATGAVLAGGLNLATATATGRSYQVLAGTNSYTGTTSIVASTLLAIERESGLGASGTGQGTTVAGTLELKGPAATAFSVAEPLTITGGTIATNAQSGTAGTNTLSGGIEVASGTATFQVNANAPLLRLTGGVTGAGAVTKTGSGTLEVAAAGTYLGTTTISAGTLALSGGDDRLPAAGTLLLNGPGRIDLGGNSQTLANFTANSNATVGSISGTVTNGTLTVNGAGDFSVANNASAGTLTVNMSGLSSLTVSKNANFVVQGATFNGGNQDQSLALAAGTNTITVNAFLIGSQAGLGAESAGVLQLGAANTLQANEFNLGKTARGTGTIEFQAGLPGTPSVTIRNRAGTGRANVFLSEQWGGGAELSAGTLNFAGGTVDALLGTVEVGRNTANARIGTGTITMGTAGGTIDATTVTLGLVTTAASGTATGTFTQNGSTSTVTIDSLVMGNSTSSSTATVNATYALANGTLRARSITAGAGTGAITAATRKIDWTGGTIRNYDAATDLSIAGVAGTGGTLAINLLGSTHTFQADAGRTITLGSHTTLAGTGGITKAGLGTLVVAMNAAYAGATTVSEGTLRVNGALAASSGITTAVGATLGGSGSVAAALAGAGRVGPGNSAGILTAPSANVSAGLDFDFEFTQAGVDPTWSSSTASVNDVLRLTDASAPFSGALAATNTVNVWLDVASLTQGDTFTGGWFTDRAIDFTSSIADATFAYYVRGDGQGPVAYGGGNFYTLAAFDAGLSIDAAAIQIGSATFAGGTVTNGYATQFSVVPEPGSLMVLGLTAGGAAGLVVRRRCRTARPRRL